MTAEMVARFVKRYGPETAVEADFRLPTDRFSVTVLFGPSGCGKTTTLRCLAGLERPDTGHISFAETAWCDTERRVFLTPQQRDIGYLFQEYALFPHLTVARNITYGLRNTSRVERRRQVEAMLDRFRIPGLADRYPQQLSGGEQQRVALARVLARRPRLLLLDEPLSALDQPAREQLRPELRRMLAEFGIPVVLVTHDRIEAMTLADWLIVLEHGKARQQGTVEDVFSRPMDVAVARIVGMENVHAGRIVRTEDGLATVAVGTSQLHALAPTSEVERVFVCIRAEEVVLERNNSALASPRNRLAGVVHSVVPDGPLVRVVIDCGFALNALITRAACHELDLRTGETVTALVKASSVHLIPRS